MAAVGWVRVQVAGVPGCRSSTSDEEEEEEGEGDNLHGLGWCIRLIEMDYPRQAYGANRCSKELCGGEGGECSSQPWQSCEGSGCVNVGERGQDRAGTEAPEVQRCISLPHHPRSFAANNNS